MWRARAVWGIRNSCRHFRIVFAGRSDRVISPAIFSRKRDCTRRGHDGGYIRMTKCVSTRSDSLASRRNSIRGAVPHWCQGERSQERVGPQMECDVAFEEQPFAAEEIEGRPPALHGHEQRQTEGDDCLPARERSEEHTSELQSRL